MVRKIRIQKKQKMTEVSKTEAQRQPLRTMWSAKLVKTTRISSQNCRMSQLRKKGTLRENVQTPGEDSIRR